MSNCSTTLLVPTDHTTTDLALVVLALACCLVNVIVGGRATFIYSKIRDPKTLALAYEEANAHQTDWNQERLALIRAANNLRNDAIVFCICILVSWSVAHGALFVLSIIRYAQGCSDLDKQWSPYYYTMTECRMSALLDQYLSVSTCVAIVLYSYSLSFRPVSHKVLFWLTHLVGAATTLLLWFGTEAQERSREFRFGGSAPWCWLEDRNNRGSEVTYDLLKVACAYIFLFFVAIFGVIALVSLRRRLSARESARRVVDLRLMPQIFVFLATFLFGGVVRFVAPVTPREVQGPLQTTFAVAFVFVYTSHAALAAMAWAFGEGILKALLMPWKYSVLSLDHYRQPFSAIADQLVRSAPSWSGVDETLVTSHNSDDDITTPEISVAQATDRFD